jgi:hypothetical protein
MPTTIVGLFDDSIAFPDVGKLYPPRAAEKGLQNHENKGRLRCRGPRWLQANVVGSGMLVVHDAATAEQGDSGHDESDSTSVSSAGGGD